MSLPALPDLKYQGPLSAPGSMEFFSESARGSEDYFLGLAAGDRAEAIVLRKLQEFSRSENVGLRLFHNQPIIANHLILIGEAFKQSYVIKCY